MYIPWNPKQVIIHESKSLNVVPVNIAEIVWMMKHHQCGRECKNEVWNLFSFPVVQEAIVPVNLYLEKIIKLGFILGLQLKAKN